MGNKENSGLHGKPGQVIDSQPRKTTKVKGLSPKCMSCKWFLLTIE